MHQPSNDIFILIKSLSRTEKRYFKITVNRHLDTANKNENNYSKLFDAIETQDRYCEEELREKFKHEGFIKHFAITKHFLYEAIIKSLNQMYSKKSIQSQLQFLLGQVELLFGKALYKQCLKALNKVQKLAEEHEQSLFAYQALVWKKKLLPYVGRTWDIEAFFEEDRRITERLNNETLFSRLLMRAELLYDKVLKNRVLTELDSKELERIKQHPLLAANGEIKTFLSKLYFFQIKNLCAKIEKNSTEALEVLEKIMNLWENAPKKRLVFIEWYQNTTVEYVLYQLDKNKTISIDFYINQLNDILSLSNSEDYKRIFITNLLQFISALHKNDLAVCEELIDAINDDLTKYKDTLPISWKAILEYHVGLFYFVNDAHLSAISLLKTAKKVPNTSAYSYIHNTISSISLISQYELGDKKKLRSRWRVVARRLASKNKANYWQNIIVETIKKLLVMHTPQEKHEVFKDLQIQLDVAENWHPLHQRIINSWVDKNLGPTIPNIIKKAI